MAGLKRGWISVCVCGVLAGTTGADIVHVRATGVVEYNQFMTGTLAGVPVGAPVTLEFNVDSANIVASPSLPTRVRGYPVILSSWSLMIGAVNVPLRGAAAPMFAVRNNDPGVDGFFLSLGPEVPTGVPVSIGLATNYGVRFGRTFSDATTLSSLDIVGAQGSWGVENLSVYSFDIDFNDLSTPLGVEYQTLTISAVVCPSVAGQSMARTPCPGGTVGMQATGAGTGPLAFAWRKGGVAINLSDPRFSVATSANGLTSTLSITGVMASDAGSGASGYVCTITNACGSGASASTAPISLTLCPANFDCNSTLDVGDIFAFLAAWFADSPSADFNQTDGVTVADIFAFLGAWFAGCG